MDDFAPIPDRSLGVRELAPESPAARRQAQVVLELRDSVERREITSRTRLDDILKLPTMRLNGVTRDELARLWPVLFRMRSCRECEGVVAQVLCDEPTQYVFDAKGRNTGEVYRPRRMTFRCESCGHEWLERIPGMEPQGLEPDDRDPADYSGRIRALLTGIAVWPAGSEVRRKVVRALRDIYGVEVGDDAVSQPQRPVLPAAPLTGPDPPPDEYPDDIDIPF